MANYEAPLYVGIDGGGTSCRARITDNSGKVLGEGKAGSANVYQSAEGALTSVLNAIDLAIEQAGLESSVISEMNVGMGLAGAEISNSIDFLNAWQHPFKTMIFNSDAHIACIGAHQGENGAILIVGTGVAGWLIEDNNIWNCSGWGFPLADQGSGAWLGLRLIQETLHAVDGLRPHSEATKKVLSDFNNDPTDIAVWAATANSGDYGHFAPLCVYGQPDGDPVADSLMKEQASVVSRLLDRMIEQGSGKICLLGGLTPFVQKNLDAKYAQHIDIAHGDAMDGALIMIRQHLSK
jgi:glucosamine kinase